MTISIEWVGPTLKNKYVGNVNIVVFVRMVCHFAQKIIYSFSLLCNGAEMMCSNHQTLHCKSHTQSLNQIRNIQMVLKFTYICQEQIEIL